VIYVVNFSGVILVEPARNASVLSKGESTFGAVLYRYLHFLASKAFDFLYFFELHAFGLTSLLELKLLVMAQLARVVDFAAGCLHVAFIGMCVQFRW
jgi:hypothetical protein